MKKAYAYFLVLCALQAVPAPVSAGAKAASQAALPAWTAIDLFAGLPNLHKTAFNGRGIGIAVGTSGIYRSTDGGKKWVKAVHRPDMYLSCLAFLDSNTVFAMGNDHVAYRSVDEGLRWSRIDIPEFSAHAMAFADAKTGVALDFQNSKLIRTEDGGLTWVEMTGNGTAIYHPRDIAFASESIAIMTADGGVINRSTDGGVTWNRVEYGLDLQSAALNGVAFANDKIGIVAGTQGTILRTTDAGISWRLVGKRLDTPQAKPVVAIGKDGHGMVADRGYFLLTTDFGESWNPIALPDPAMNYADAVVRKDANTWLVNYQSILIRSEDAGQSWNPVALETPKPDLFGLAILPDGRGMVVGGHETIVQPLKGHWDKFEMSFGPRAEDLEAIAFKDSLAGAAVGAKGFLMHTSDRGRSWLRVAEGLTSLDLHSVAFSEDGGGCAVGDHGSLFCTPDGGKAWNPVNAGDAGPDLRAIAFTKPGTAVAVGDAGRLQISRDAGSTWSRIDHNLTDRNLRCLSFKDSLLGLAAGEAGTLLKTEDGGVTWTGVSGIPSMENIISVSISKAGLGAVVFSGKAGAWGFNTKGGSWMRLTDIEGLWSFKFTTEDHGIAVGSGSRLFMTGPVKDDLAAPSGLFTAQNDVREPEGIRLGWSAIPWSDGYRVSIAEDSLFSNTVLDTGTASNTSLLFTNVDTSKTYFWRVRAINFSGPGPFSAVQVFGPTRFTPVTVSGPGDWTSWTAPSRITGMAFQDSLLWLGTDDGLARLPLRGGSSTIYTTRNSGLFTDSITALSVSHDDEILMGTPIGVNILKEGHWTSYHYQNSPLAWKGKPAPVSAVMRATDGSLWAGLKGRTVYTGPYAPTDSLSGKLYRLAGDTWSEMPLPYTDDLDSRRGTIGVLDLLPRAGGGIWLNFLALGVFGSGHGSSNRVYGYAADTMGPIESKFPNRYFASIVPPIPASRQLDGPVDRQTLFGMAADTRGVWGSYWEGGSDMNLAILDCPANVAQATHGIPFPRPKSYATGAGAQVLERPLLFALHPSGETWVKILDTLYKHLDSSLAGIELLPAEIAGKGPFEEMKIDGHGVVYLRKGNTVYWKGKSTVFPVRAFPKGRAIPGLELVRSGGGLSLRLGKATTVRVEYLDLQGRASEALDLGHREPGVMRLPRAPAGQTLLRIDAGKERKYFVIGPGR